MNFFTINSYLRPTQPTHHASSTSSKNQVGELRSNAIKNLFASLKVLGFEKTKQLCELKLRTNVTESEIRNVISQMCSESDKLNSDWLFNLNNEGVQKIQKIIDCIQDKKKEFSTISHFQKKFIQFSELFRESIGRDIYTTRVIYINKYGAILLRKELLNMAKKDTTLLTPIELDRLYWKDCCELNVPEIYPMYRKRLLPLKIAEANNFDLKTAGREELCFLFDHIKSAEKSEQASFIRLNFGAVIQVTLQCLGSHGIHMSEAIKKDALLLLCKLEWALRLDEIHNSTITRPFNVVSSEIVNNLPELNSDLQSELFKSMSSTNDQWNFARTSKYNLQRYAIFCKDNLRHDMGDMDYLCVRGKLTVERFLELTDCQIKFLTEKATLSCILEDKISVESALLVSDLIEKYKQSGWRGLILR